MQNNDKISFKDEYFAIKVIINVISHYLIILLPLIDLLHNRQERQFICF